MYSGRDTPKGWVSPFGHPRINDRSHLPAAFRSVPRPSSPLGAKASTECPSLTPYPHHRPRTGPNHAPCNYQPVRAAAPASSPASRSNAARRCAPLTHTQNHLHHVKEHARPARHPAPSRGSWTTPHERVSEVPPPLAGQHTRPSTVSPRRKAQDHFQAPKAQGKMETVGFEPTTPCLQSRCSPTELRPRGRGCQQLHQNKTKRHRSRDAAPRRHAP